MLNAGSGQHHAGLGPAPWPPRCSRTTSGSSCPSTIATGYDGTLTQALVVPLMRSLFGRQLAHPLAEEFACSAAAADAFLAQPSLGDRPRPSRPRVLAARRRDRAGLHGRAGRAGAADGDGQPARPRRSGRTVGRVAGALFALAEQSEQYWLDVRGSEPVRDLRRAARAAAGRADRGPRAHAGRLRQGVRDLLPVWERILAPENLGEVLELSDRPLERFRFSDRLWARVVYDFLLAYRARVVYRGHARPVARPALPGPRGLGDPRDAHAATRRHGRRRERLGGCSRRRSPTWWTGGDEAPNADEARRPIVIEHVQPRGGRRPLSRSSAVVGDASDRHRRHLQGRPRSPRRGDPLPARRARPTGASAPLRTRWTTTAGPGRSLSRPTPRYRFTVEAWTDTFGSWVEEMRRRLAGGQTDLGERAAGRRRAAPARARRRARTRTPPR